MTSAAAAANAFKQWELENKVKPTSDAYFGWDPVKYKQYIKAQPWGSLHRGTYNPMHFEKVFISSLALLKILAHAKTGQGKAGVISQDKSNWVEIMGMLQGYSFDKTVVVMDSFALPVEGTEVEAVLSDAAQAYWANYNDATSQLRPDAGVGWYHSHPGLGSYMSATDCNTQRLSQPHIDPWVALVIDPVKSLVTGAVDFGVFRVNMEVPAARGQAAAAPTAQSTAMADNADMPLSKIAEYGSCFREYYKLDVTVFRSEGDAKLLELLWSQYCIAALSGSPLVSNRHFIDGRLETNLKRIEAAEDKLIRSRAQSQQGGAGFRSRSAGSGKKKDEAHPLEPLTRFTGGSANEVLQGLLGMLVKERVFNVPA